MILEVVSDLTWKTHYAGKRHSVALTARVTARDWTVNCVGLFESKQLGRFKVKQSVIDIRTG